MQKIKFGNTGMDISTVLYGGIVSMQDGQDNSDKYVDYAIKKGINYFDVAPSYGDAEEKLGNSIKDYRKDVFLACKTGKRLAVEAEKEFEKSLKLLHTDYFDVYQMHALTTMEDVETAFGKGGVLEMMLKYKEQGVVKNLGITCHNEDVALRAFELYDFDTLLFPTNWGLNMKKGFGSRLAKLQKEKNFGFLGMKSMVHRAWLSDEEKAASRFPKSWCMPITDNDKLTIAAIRYAFSMGVNSIVPPGNIENFTFAVENIDEILKPLTTEDKELLAKELVNIEGHYFF